MFESIRSSGIRQTPTKEKQHQQEFGSLYDFFCLAEQSERILTSKEIRKEAFRRNIKTVRRHISRHWSWFLHPVDTQKRQVTYQCKGIGKYPKDYFIQAHKSNQMQYFYHFARSIEAYERRKEEERQKRQEVLRESEQLPLPEVELLEETTDQQEVPPQLDIQIAEETEPAEPVEQTEPGEGLETTAEDKETKPMEPVSELHFQASPTTYDHVHISPLEPSSGEAPESSSPVKALSEGSTEKTSGGAGVHIHNVEATSSPSRRLIILLVVAALILLALLVTGYISIRKWFS